MTLHREAATTSIAAATVLSPVTPVEARELDVRRDQRAALKSRHSQGLTRLMEERNDLRGVHALADFVDDAIRWTA